MNDKPTCASCAYYVPRHDVPYGQCHRHAPRPFSHSEAIWAEVNAGDWCGEHSDAYLVESRRWLKLRSVSRRAQDDYRKLKLKQQENDAAASQAAK